MISIVEISVNVWVWGRTKKFPPCFSRQVSKYKTRPQDRSLLYLLQFGATYTPLCQNYFFATFVCTVAELLLLFKS